MPDVQNVVPITQAPWMPSQDNPNPGGNPMQGGLQVDATPNVVAGQSISTPAASGLNGQAPPAATGATDYTAKLAQQQTESAIHARGAAEIAKNVFQGFGLGEPLKTAPGQGWLAGASHALVANQENSQKQKQQNIENQMKQQELTEKQKTESAQRAYYSAQTAASIQKAQQEASTYAQEQAKSAVQLKAGIIDAIGADAYKDLEQISSYDQLSQDHAHQLGSGQSVAVQNGESHSKGEDKVAATILPGSILKQTIRGPQENYIVGYKPNAETGKPEPVTATIPAGTSVEDLVAVHTAALGQLNRIQDQEASQAKIDLEKAEASQYGPLDPKMKQDFISQTLPGYDHIAKNQQAGLVAEASNAKTRKEFDSIQNKALQLETNGLNKVINEQNIRANKEIAQTDALSKKGVEDINKVWSDPQHGYTQAVSQAQLTKDSIQAGVDGNGLVTSMIPTMEVLGINSFGGTHRISPAEAAAANLPGGKVEQYNAWFTKAASGKLTPQLAQEGQALMSDLISAAHKKAIAGTQVIAQNSGIPADRITVLDTHSNPDTLQHQLQVAIQPQNAAGKAPGPDGYLHWATKDGKDLGRAE